MAAAFRAISCRVNCAAGDRRPHFSTVIASNWTPRSANRSKMGNINSHDTCEPEKLPSTVVGTPVGRDFSYLDPRSPTLEIVRTPLEIPQTHHSRLRRLVSLLDPRSPSTLVNRTPLQQIPQEKVQPVAAPTPRELCLGSTDLGTIDTCNEDSMEVQEKESTEPIDLKTARALFFGDMSVTASPISSPGSRLEPSPVKPEEVLVCEEEIETAEDVVMESEVEIEAAIEVPCIDEAILAAKPTLGAVKCVEHNTPTVLVRRQGKENVLQKQLFQTPDKTRVRTPLSNVSSFHNSPLRR